MVKERCPHSFLMHEKGNCDVCAGYESVKKTTDVGQSGLVVGYTQADLLEYLNNDNSLLTVHILRNWKRDKIERFAKHLLGMKCQECTSV